MTGAEGLRDGFMGYLLQILSTFVVTPIGYIKSTVVSFMDSGATENIPLAASECNRQPGFQPWELPA